MKNSQLKDGEQEYEDWLKDHEAFRKELKKTEKCDIFLYAFSERRDCSVRYRCKISEQCDRCIHGSDVQ